MALFVAAAVTLSAGTVQAGSINLNVDTVADETGFGALWGTLGPTAFQSDVFPLFGFAGTIESRVYTKNNNAEVTFVYEINVDPQTNDPIEVMTLARDISLSTPDLDFFAVAGGSAGIVESGTSSSAGTPEFITVSDNETIDRISWDWRIGDEPGAGEQVTLFVQTDGNIDIGIIPGIITDFGGVSIEVLAPLNDPNNPDLSVVPLPAAAWMGLGALGVLAGYRRCRARR